jgi:hypothetical protein
MDSFPYIQKRSKQKTYKNQRIRRGKTRVGTTTVFNSVLLGTYRSRKRATSLRLSSLYLSVCNNTKSENIINIKSLN